MIENLDATRCPTRTNLSYGPWTSVAATWLTPGDCPPVVRLRRYRVWVEGLLRDLQYLLRPHLRFVRPPICRVNCGLVCYLDVQPNFVAFTRYDHTRAVVGMDGGLVPDIGEVCLGYYIDDSPYIILHTPWSAMSRD